MHTIQQKASDFENKFGRSIQMSQKRQTMGESERLGFLINQLKTNAFQFSKRAKIAQGTVSGIISGKRRMSRDIIDQIAKAYPEVSIEWILRGIGEMFHEPLKQVEKQIVSEEVDFNRIKSPISLQSDGLPDEEIMKSILSENLRTAGKRWKLTQAEMLDLLGGSVGRGGASTYFRGDTLPRLPLLLRLERLTGWPLVVLATRALEFDELPPMPLVDAPVLPNALSEADSEELAAELNRLKLRIVRIITQLKGEL